MKEKQTGNIKTHHTKYYAEDDLFSGAFINEMSEIIATNSALGYRLVGTIMEFDAEIKASEGTGHRLCIYMSQFGYVDPKINREMVYVKEDK